MNTFSELIAAVQSDQTIGSESALFPLATVKQAINRARIKAYGLYRWPELEDAMKTWTVASQEYYDFPEEWEADSLWKLKVDGTDYGDPLAFRDYLFEKENDFPSHLDQMWSVFGRQIFIYPTPTVTKTQGIDDANICVWGQTAKADLVNDSDVTIFSYSKPEGNEAIVLEAVAILRNKGGQVQPVARSFIGGTQLLSFDAQNILGIAWNKIKQNQAKYERTTEMFDVPDFFKN